MITTLTILLIIILLAIWNGLVIEWKLKGKYSNQWHFVGGLIRALLIGLVYVNSGLWLAIGTAFLCWMPYNMIINKIMGNGLFYLSDKGIDGFIKRLIKRTI